jgi:hypothetical protein
MIDTTLIIRSITVEDDGRNATISLCIHDDKGFIEVVRLRIGVAATQTLCVGMPLHFFLEKPEQIIIHNEKPKDMEEIPKEISKDIPNRILKKIKVGKNV